MIGIYKTKPSKPDYNEPFSRQKLTCEFFQLTAATVNVKFYLRPQLMMFVEMSQPSLIGHQLRQKNAQNGSLEMKNLM